MKRGAIFLFAILLVISTAPAFCGDGLVDPDESETCTSCPQDNPCLVDQRCVNNRCINKLIPPLLLKEDPKATIIIPREIAETINSLLNQPHEFAACLEGRYSDGIYQITKIEFPEIAGQGLYAVEHAKCKGLSVIATIHSHLDGNCEMSRADIFNFGQKNEPLAAIICGENDIAFYSKKSFDKRMNYIVREIGDTRLTYFWSLFPWVFSGLLIISLLILFYERERIYNLRKKELAVYLIEKFTSQEKNIINTLVEKGSLKKRKINSSLLLKLTKKDLVEEKNNEIRLRHWFKKALKKI
ncbi:MAG: hypothetical protein ABIB47_01075 [Candidatus Woesearchaeota archaeon]